MYVDDILAGLPSFVEVPLEVQLHAFCDTFKKAYATTLYSRVQTPSGEFITLLLAAKTKVATIKMKLYPD